jgi:hypothetical protein
MIASILQFFNLTQLNGTAVDTNNGNKSAGTLRVTLATDQVALTNALKVDGSAVVQPVSATALPLPTGAATETTLAAVLTQADFDTKVGSLTETAPGTDTASSGLNGRLQRIAARLTSLIALLPTALGAGGGLKVDGSGTALPVSGTVTANIGTAGTLALDATLTGGTQKSLVRGTAKGATSAADVTATTVDADHNALDVFIKGGAGSGGTAIADNAAFAPGTTQFTPVGAEVDDTGTTAATENSAGVLRMTTQRALHSNLRNASGVELAYGEGVSGTDTLRVSPAFDGAKTLQASQTSGVTNATTTRTTTTGLGKYVDALFLLNITNGGAATGSLQLFLEDSVDGGTTWHDLVSSPVFTFGGAVTTYLFAVSGRLATSLSQSNAATVETLTAGTARQGPFGDRIRVREKVSGVGGTPTGVTYTISAVFKA